MVQKLLAVTTGPFSVVVGVFEELV